MENKLGGVLEPVVGGFDLVYNNGHIRVDKSACYTTRLGCFDDRVRQLKKLHKAHAKRAQAAAVERVRLGIEAAGALHTYPY